MNPAPPVMITVGISALPPRRGWRRPAPGCGRELTLAYAIHLVAELCHHRDRREAGHPVPELLDLLADQLLGGRQLAMPALDARAHHGAQVVEIVEEDVVHLRDRGIHVARKRDVED